MATCLWRFPWMWVFISWAQSSPHFLAILEVLVPGNCGLSGANIPWPLLCVWGITEHPVPSWNSPSEILGCYELKTLGSYLSASFMGPALHITAPIGMSFGDPLTTILDQIWPQYSLGQTVQNREIILHFLLFHCFKTCFILDWEPLWNWMFSFWTFILVLLSLTTTPFLSNFFSMYLHWYIQKSLTK